MAPTSDIISIGQCLAHMHSGRAFSCEVYTYDRRRKTGGELRHYEEAVLLRPDGPGAEAATGRPATRMEHLRAELARPKLPKNPHHRRWYTRNIRILQAGHPTGIVRKLHPPLLRRFNGKTVVP